MKAFTGFKLFVLSILLLLLLQPQNSIRAQNITWSYPQTIPSLDVNAWPPILVADQQGVVHAFSSQFIELQGDERKNVIVYNKWTPETDWSAPVDILISPNKEARVTDVYLDKEGYFHLLFFGGDGTDADIYYSKVSLNNVSNSRSWITPFIIGDNAGDPEGAVFAYTKQDRLVVIFNGRQFGNGIYAVASDDHGDSWSFPWPIFIADDKAPNIFYLEAIESESGWLHIIWDVFSDTGQGRGIYYTRSIDGETWDQPTLLVGADEGLGTQTPTLIENGGVLYAVYNLPPKIVMQRSFDEGGTWQAPVIMFSRHIGVNGSLSLVEDSNKGLHILFGQRISGNPDIHGMWYSIWLGNQWTEPEAVVKGPQVRDVGGPTSFDPNSAQAVVMRGNVILVTWRTDPGLTPNGIWYSYKTIKAPESAKDTLLTLETPQVPATQIFDLIPIATSTELSLEAPSPPAQTDLLLQPGNSFRGVIVYSILSVISITLVIIFYVRWKANR